MVLKQISSVAVKLPSRAHGAPSAAGSARAAAQSEGELDETEVTEDQQAEIG